MELTRFQRYAITKVSDIIDIQFKHITTYLARIPMTRIKYFTRQNQIVVKRTAIGQTIAHYIMIILLLLLSQRWFTTFDAFIHVCEQVLKIDQYEDFIYTGIIGFVAFEIIVSNTFNEVYHYRCGLLDVAGEVAEYQFRSSECRELIKSFLRISTIDGIMYKIAAYGLIPLTIHMNIQAIIDYMNNEITKIELPVCWLYSFGTNGYASVSLSLLFIVMPHLYFMMLVFQIRVNHCLQDAQIAIQTQSRIYLMKFVYNYIHLHRWINVYNSSIRNHIATHDMVFKVSGMVSITFYIKQEQKLNQFAYLILGLYLATYGTFLFVESRLTYFPKRNERLYRSMNGLNAKLCHNHNLHIQRRWQRISNLGEVRYVFVLNRMCDFLSNNRFGFTYGRSYIITNSSIANALIGNFYMFVLFYKRLAV